MDRGKLHSVVDDIMDGVTKATETLETAFNDALEGAKEYDFVATAVPNKFQLKQKVTFDGTKYVVIGMFITRTDRILYNIVDDYDGMQSNVEEELLSVR